MGGCARSGDLGQARKGRLTWYSSRNKPRLKHRHSSVSAQQLGKSRQPALLIGPEVVVDMPAQVIAAEIVVILRARANNVIERVQAEIARLSRWAAQSRIVRATPQRP